MNKNDNSITKNQESISLGTMLKKEHYHNKAQSHNKIN